jgi:hypothetical protein
VARTVEAALHRPTLTDLHPKHVVALGAARIAASLLEPPSPRATPPGGSIVAGLPAWGAPMPPLEAAAPSRAMIPAQWDDGGNHTLTDTGPVTAASAAWSLGGMPAVASAAAGMPGAPGEADPAADEPGAPAHEPRTRARAKIDAAPASTGTAPRHPAGEARDIALEAAERRSLLLLAVVAVLVLVVAALAGGLYGYTYRS